MPQFSLEHFIPQLAWLALFFAILYFGIVSLTLPKVGRVVTARENVIGADLSAAERAKTEADDVRMSHDSELAKAHSDAAAAVARAKSEAAGAVQARLAAAESEVGEKVRQAAAELSHARARALTEVDRMAVEAAAEIVFRLTEARPHEAEAAAAVSAVAPNG